MQLSAFSHKAALPPLVSFGLSPDQHFEKSMKIAEGILPAERSVMVDEDLELAAAMMVGSRSELGRLRDEAIKAVRLRKHRWVPITARSSLTWMRLPHQTGRQPYLQQYRNSICGVNPRMADAVDATRVQRFMLSQ